ncbi:MAG: hypothetical protein IKD72_00875, partial [Clostridia bacterium]|nr:hypothetical protein [Clostridia bacterium]
RYDESFLGKDIVCGYSDTQADYHNTSEQSGTLNAWTYLAAGASPRFVASSRVDGLLSEKHLSLVSGEPFAEYTHDIVVKNLSDLYLDGQTGVDPVYDGNGDFVAFGTDAGGVVHDGGSPATAFKTFAACKKQIYDNLPEFYPDQPPVEGYYPTPNIIVCGRVDITGAEEWSLPAFHTNYGLSTLVRPRLARMMNNDKNAAAATRYTGYLIEVLPGGELTLSDIEISGNCGANEYPRVCSSLLHVNGGEALMREGTHLTDNNADYGGGVRVDAGRCEMIGDAKIDYCTADNNYGSGLSVGVRQSYGGGVYVRGGEFIMNGENAEISHCGPTYSMAYQETCYGALVYVNGGVFRQLNGKLSDAQVTMKGTYSYSCYIDGSVYAAGSPYDAETGTGTLVEIGDRVVNNLRGTLGANTWNAYFYVRGSAITATGGTVRLTGPLYAEVNGALHAVSPGAHLENNNVTNLSGYGYIYMNGANALLEMQGGEIVDGFTTSHSYNIYLTQGAKMHMTGGVIRSAYCSNVIRLDYSNSLYSSFTMDGGEIVRTYSSGGPTIYNTYSCTFIMNGGEIHCAEDVLPDVTALSNYGYATINGGSIYRFGSDCILTGSQSLTINGGSISGSRYSGVRQDSGSLTMNGGEIFGNSRALVMNGGTATFNKADIHHNTASGLKVQSSSATLRITSDDVVIRENSCYEHTIFVSSGTLNMTGGDVHDNRSSNGTIRVDSGANNATISSVEIYNNTSSANGAGIYLYMGSNKTHSVSACDIHDNSGGDGTGIYIYSPASGNDTNQVHLSGNQIYHNTSTAKGGGLAIYAETTGQQTLTVNMNSNTIQNNTARIGGGIYVKVGQDTTTANPGRLTFNLNAQGTEIVDNVSSGNGGGVFIERAKRNNVRASFGFQAYIDKGGTVYDGPISRNQAVNGGGVYFINNMTNANFPVINKDDVQFLFGDVSVNSNIATGDGGGIMTPGGAYGKEGLATFYFNNAELLGNAAQRGGGFFADGGAILQVSQGMIAKNEANQGAGGFVNKADLRFANNYTFIEETDHIYLNDRGYPITAWQSFTNTESVYNVYPSEAFVAGDIVVRPGTEAGGFCPDASPFLRNFYSVRPGTVIDRLAPYLILGRIVFLDGETGVDPVINGTTFVYQTDGDGVVHDGTAPDKAFKTFKASKAVLGDAPGAIYVSGPVHYRQDDPAEDDVWTLGEKQYLRRYCGFRVSSDQAYPGFAGDMFLIEQGTLTLEDLPVEGSYKADETWTAAGSVFAVCGADAKLILNDGASIKDNVTTGDGAAIRIEQGEVVLQAGEISGNATTGRGVVYQGDTLTVSGSALTLEGEIYLAAGDETESIPDRVITVVETPDVPALDFAPVNGYLTVGVENPYDGRDIVAYPAAEIPLEAQKAIYALAPEISSLYVVDNDPVAANILELRLPYQVYLDGVAGDDALDGSTPAKAVRTLQRAYELVAAAFVDPEIITSGGLVHVVDTVTVTDAVTLSSSYVCGGVTVDAGGPVTFKRYAQPTAYESIPGGGFEKPTNRNEIFIVADHSDLHLVGVTVDGHSLAVPEGSGPKLAAPGVTAQAAPVLVEDGGVFEMSAGRLQSSRVEAETPAIPGGAIHVSDGAIASVTGGVITDTLDQNGVSIYDGGELAFSGSPSIKGSVYLEQPETRVAVPAAFTPAQPVSVLPANTFNGRDIALYDAALGIPGSAEKASWKLPDDVLLNYVLNNNAEDPQILELQLRACVYVDGVDGLDTNSGADPEHSVRTLKRAYEILSGLEGSTIYIVNEVTLASSATLDHGMYLSGMDSIDAGSDVQILRYAQPTAYDPDEDDHGELNGFGVESYVAGPLITVPAGVSLILSGVTVDGHSEAITAGEPQYVSPGLVTAAALLKVSEGGTLRATGGTMLQNNNNTLPAPAGEGKGGAVENNGRLLLDAVVLRENNATHGAGVYQNSTLELNGAAGPVIGEDQWIYLTGMKAQTPEQKPQEHKIDVTGMLADTFKVTVDLEWPEIGRDMAQFSATAFLETVENEREHFALAPGLEYIIVKSPEADEPDTLELGEIPAFTLEYDGNGGTLPDGVTTRVPDPDMPYNDLLGYNAYDKGTIIEVKENSFAFQQAGETFVAWNTQPDGTGKTFLPGDSFWDETTGIFENTVLYAVWEDLDREYTVTYKPNNMTEEADVVDGPYGQLDTVTVKYNAGDGGTHFTPPDGRQFIGWNTQPDESGLWYFPPGTSLPGFIPTVTNEDGEFLIAGDIELYAIWRVTPPHSLTIFKYADLRDLKEPNKTFLFEIEDIYPLSENYGKKYYVYLGTCIDGATVETVPAWIDNAYCYATVTGLAEGKYRVRELTEWSWRYSISDAYGADTVNYTVSAGHEIVVALTDHRTVSFVNELTNPYYVNGYARSYSNTFIQP